METPIVDLCAVVGSELGKSLKSIETLSPVLQAHSYDLVSEVSEIATKLSNTIETGIKQTADATNNLIDDLKTDLRVIGLILSQNILVVVLVSFFFLMKSVGFRSTNALRIAFAISGVLIAGSVYSIVKLFTGGSRLSAILSLVSISGVVMISYRKFV